MFNYGQVVTPGRVPGLGEGDRSQAEARSGILRALPPYALTYDPTVIPQLGSDTDKVAGITGATVTTTHPQRPGDAVSGGTVLDGGAHCDEEVTGCPSR